MQREIIHNRSKICASSNMTAKTQKAKIEILQNHSLLCYYCLHNTNSQLQHYFHTFESILFLQWAELQWIKRSLNSQIVYGKSPDPYPLSPYEITSTQNRYTKSKFQDHQKAKMIIARSEPSSVSRAMRWGITPVYHTHILTFTTPDTFWTTVN